MSGNETASHKRENLSSIREIITNLNRADLVQADYSYIVRQIGILIKGLPLTAYSIPKGTFLYRGVRYIDKPFSIEKLGSPFPELVTGFQRCNAPNKPMFYASVDISAIFAEIGAKAGEKVYLSRWIVEDEFFYFRIPPTGADEIQKDAAFSKIETFFETKFAQPIHETYSEQYKITAAIAEKLSTGDLNGNAEIKNRKLGGVVYPSVAHTARSDNIAIQSSIAETCLSLQDVREIYITESAVDCWQVQETDFSANFVQNKIRWAGRASRWTLAPNEFLKFTVENQQWVARSLDGTIIQPT